MARVKSDIFVAGLLRAAQSRGIMGAVVSSGFSDSGSVFIVTYDPDTRLNSLWAPAPQASIIDDEVIPAGGRYFERRKAEATQDDIDRHLESERKFDPDIWVVELEAADKKLAGLFDGFT